MSEEVEQWCVKVPLSEGESKRRELISSGLADRNFRPRAENGFLLIPVLSEIDGAVREIFKETQAREELARHEQVGGIVILQDDDVEGAKKILAARPSVHTALFATSPVEGEFRTKTFKVLAGVDTTETIYTEYGKRMIVDMTAAYFSARLSNERQRLLSLMREGENILDMFCGVGPFPVMLGAKAGFVVANDINPSAVYLLQKNLGLNRLKNVVPMVGDAKNLPYELGDLKFDRIIMNLPFDAYEFLEAASKLAKPNAIIHLYSLVEKDGEHMEDIRRAFPDAVITEKFIRSYSPTSWHAVYDIETGYEV
ncbi:MAG: class I SAM-dependent methyltransferase family protein [Methanocorpusculum sp.]|nr:class I SAM-dependent methyltransferase family protein [Methanocorpusculum sp.]